MNGLLVIDKPLGMTSRAAVDCVANWFRDTRVGHTGTLDPAATGVLVMCLGSATRLAEYVQALDKVYHADVMLGARSTTDDTEGLITPEPSAQPVTRYEIDAVLPSFLGVIEQVPPAFSAAKVKGRRAYHLARRGKDVVIEPRQVRIDAIEILDFNHPILRIEVRCGKGTYIRSLARDLGERLGTGAYLSALRRMRVGSFRVEDAIAPDDGADAALAHLRPVHQAVAHLPRVVLPAPAAARFMNGQALPAERPEGEVAVFTDDGRLVAVGQVRGQVLDPIKVFRPS
jgi:tRNA pseudouridine55 synthase